MDSKNNTQPSLLIPRLTKEYIRDGFKTLDYYTFYDPEVVLNFHYPDAVLFALLAHVKKPKNVLDFGSFFGLLPFVVEEIFRSAGSREQFSWTLVDTCLYTKELAEAIRNNTPVTGRYLNANQFNGWHEDNVPTWKESSIFQKVGKYYLPPSTPGEFNGYWFRLSRHYNIPKPIMVMFENIEEVQGKKFDLVHFDLTAGDYTLNKNMLEYLVKHNLSDDGIIVFDDMRPQHPRMLLFFQYILATTDFRPIAFSTGKIAMMRKRYKEDFINKVDAEGLMEIEHTRDSYYSFQLGGGLESDWGDFLDIRAN